MSEIKLKLSASRKKTYQQCPRKYFYRYNEKLQTKEWDHFSLGTLTHGVLEHFHEEYRIDDKNINLKKLMKISFKKQRNEMEKKSSLKDSILLEARDLLSKYLKRIEIDGIGSKIISLEKNFNIKLNDKYIILGFIDRIDIDNDGIYHIKDYKTTKNAKYMDNEQLLIYGIYLLNEYPEVDFFRGSYIMLKCDNDLHYEFNAEDVKKEREKLIKCADKICEEEKWTTKVSKLCDYCDFKDVCLNSWKKERNERTLAKTKRSRNI